MTFFTQCHAEFESLVARKNVLTFLVSDIIIYCLIYPILQ